jgi:hypothetical protein
MMFVGLSVTMGCDASADIVESTPAGFQISEVLSFSSAPDKVYAAIVDISHWWDPAHTYSGDPANLSLNPIAGGCFCESLANGGGVQHMTVVNVAPNRQLVLRGALGPLQSAGLAGSMIFSLAPAANGTTLTFKYTVGGYFPGGLDKIAPAVNGMLHAQLQRLKALTEVPAAASGNDAAGSLKK